MTITLSPKILLVGTGNMAREYAKVLKTLKKSLIIVGRGNKSALDFQKTTGLTAVKGGIENWLENNAATIPSMAIVAIDEENLGPVTQSLIKAGVKKILVEKPGGMDLKDLEETKKLATKMGAKVFIGYNRRFYSSVIKTQEIIKKDGGVISFNFDFTELSHLIEKSKKTPRIKNEWLLMNSSHVLDLAFFLGGKPKKINPLTAGGLSWHTGASIYAGAGVSKNGALFSYHANWESGGRWGVEVMTNKHKIILRPLEKLQVQKKGSMTVAEIPIQNNLDTQFKPGLYLQVKSFLGNTQNLPTINEQIENVKYYNLIDQK